MILFVAYQRQHDHLVIGFPKLGVVGVHLDVASDERWLLCCIHLPYYFMNVLPDLLAQ